MKKVLLGSLVLAGVFSACTNEEILVDNQNNDALNGRPQVNLTLTTGVESRMSNGTGWANNFTTNDILGAVLVDKGYAAAVGTGIKYWNNVDWTVIDGHVGNNKWSYVDNGDGTGQFETAGTTAVGAWLFYTKYNEKMTTTRNGVEFDFPQIQDGEVNFEYLANDNVNFLISPVVALDGYEGKKIAFPIAMASVYNYLRLPFDFSALSKVAKVQKIIVKATDVNGVDVEFPTEYVVKNTVLPVARMSLESSLTDIACPTHTNHSEATCLVEEMNRAKNAYIYNDLNSTATWDAWTGTYNKAVISRNSSADVDYLVVDFEKEHANLKGEDFTGSLAIAEDGKFSAMMLMPAGVYGSITFEIYTDNGVYTKTIADRNVYRENIDPATAPQQRGPNAIFLRPDKITVLSDIENILKATDNNDDVLSAEEYIKVKATDFVSNQARVITKTADLINFINGINATGTYNVEVIEQDEIGGDNNADDASFAAHSVEINKDVMAALVTKQATYPSLHLVFTGKTMPIIGETEAAPLEIHDMTFNRGCIVKSGYVKATNDIEVPTYMRVQKNADIELALVLDDLSAWNFNQLSIDLGAVVSATESTTIKKVNSNGNLTIKEGKTINSNNVNNFYTGSVVVDGTWNIDTQFENAGWYNSSRGEITINGEINLSAPVAANGDATSINNGLITNNKNLTIVSLFANNGEITNNADALILARGSQGVVRNDGSIDNYGSMYTYQGINKIHNYGTIKARENSTTYITTNSMLDEAVNGTQVNGQVMGTIELSRRNEDVSVTENEYQGYIKYTVPATVAKLEAVKHDKFNKVVLQGEIEITSGIAARINYIEKNAVGALTLPAGMSVQEIEFKAKTTLYADAATARVNLGYVTVGANVEVKVPTENAINVKNIIIGLTFKTDAAIKNAGKIIVGGDLYSTLPDTTPNNNGIFASGDGQKSAFHWGETSL